MGKKIRLIAIVSILVLNVFMAAKHLIADSYYRIAHHDGKDLNKAIGYLEKCVAIDSRNPLFHFSLGRVYLRKGLVEDPKVGKKNMWVRKSIDEFHKAIELKPSASDYHFHIGLAYRCLAYPPSFSWRVIESSFRRTAMLNPTDVRHLDLIGKYYLDEYRRLKGIRIRMDVIGLDIHENQELLLKDRSQLYLGLKRIRILLDEGRLDEAIDEYHTIMKKHPMSSNSLYDLIRYYQKKKNYPRAISILNEAIASILN